MDNNLSTVVLDVKVMRVVWHMTGMLWISERVAGPRSPCDLEGIAGILMQVSHILRQAS